MVVVINRCQIAGRSLASSSSSISKRLVCLVPTPGPLETGTCCTLFRSRVAACALLLLRLRFSPLPALQTPPKGRLDDSYRAQLQLFVFLSLPLLLQSFGVLLRQPSTLLDEGMQRNGRSKGLDARFFLMPSRLAILDGECANQWGSGLDTT